MLLEESGGIFLVDMNEENKTPIWPLAIIAIVIISAIFLKIQQSFEKDFKDDSQNFIYNTSTESVSGEITENTTTPESMKNNLKPSVPPKSTDQDVKSDNSVNTYQSAEITINGKKLNVLLADTVEKRFKGLSDRTSLGEYDGMLFLFYSEGKYTFVMRDMLFPLDIIWINRDEVVHVAENLPPEAGRPEGSLTAYTNDISAMAVLEVPAGFVKANEIKLGDKVVY